MNRKVNYALSAGFLALVLVAALAIAMAAPAAHAQEIPAASVSRNAPTFATLFTGVVNTATAASTYGDVYDVTPYDGAEMQLVVDQTVVAAAANTTTVVIQYSNDRINWTDQAVKSGNTADLNEWSTPTVTGHYWRAKVTPSNALPVTVTLSAVMKPAYASPVNVSADVTVLTVTVPAE